MSILDELSSQAGTRSEYSNRRAALRCVEEPDLIQVIADGLSTESAKMQGDCAEVLAMVAENCPDLVAPHAKPLIAKLDHPRKRVRWEAMHALALIAPRIPRLTSRLLPKLGDLIQRDESVIVRDYATDALTNYAATGPRAAQKAYPFLKEALSAWEGKQAAHALEGLLQVAAQAPKLRPEIRDLAAAHAKSARRVVRQAAKRILKATE